MSSIAQAKFQAVPKVQSRISLEAGLVILLLGLTFALRITNLNYNIPFVDEAIYATVGEEILAGQDLQVASAWMFGSYFYPIAAYYSNEIAGLVGQRALSAVLSTTAALFVFLTAWRLFDLKSGIWALFLFGLSGSSISVGQFGTYDVMGLPFLAISLYCLVAAALTAHPRRQTVYLLLGGLTFSLSFLGKYIALLYLPTLVLIGAVLFRNQGKSLRPLFDRFLALIAVLIGAYVLYFLFDLANVLKGENSSQLADRLIILQVIAEENGLAFVLAGVGTVAAAAPFLRRAVSQRDRLLLVSAALALFAATMALPAYHVMSSNIRALEKHTVYALIFLSPLAGFGLATIIRHVQGLKRRRVQVAGALLTIGALMWVVNYALDRNWGFQNSWPNVSDAIQYLREHGVNENSLVLASGSAIYEYAFDFNIWSNRNIWYSTWYMKYKDIEGVEAMKLAIADRAVDYVILDDYYTPEMNAVLEPLLEAAGYRLDWQEALELGSGDTIRVRIFIPPTEGVQP